MPNKDKEKRYQCTYRWRKKRRDYFVSLLGGVCAKCGSCDNLEFDHVNPKEKKYNISMILTDNFKKLHSEIMKCQLLCAGCHKEKTLSYIKERYPQKPPKTFMKRSAVVDHGNSSMYRRGCRCDACKKAKVIENKRRFRVEPL